MKRIITIFAIVAVLVSMVSCGWSFVREGSEEKAEVVSDSEEESEVDNIIDTRPRVYSNAYDGFTNIRAWASSKANVIGKLRNGPEGAVYLGAEGNWAMVECDGRVGYVYKKYVQDTPTKRVTIDVDGNWLEGVYQDEGRYCTYLIFNNGKFAYEHQYGNISYGRYRLEGNEIVLTSINRRNDLDLPITPVERLKVDVARRKIGNYTKEDFVSEYEYSRGEYYGENVWTKSRFKNDKKSYSKLVK